MDPNFVPYTTTFSLHFDPTVIERHADGGPFGEVLFAAGNAFLTPFTSGLPWATPEAVAADRERNLAVFEFEKLSETEGQRYMYWDDSYRHNDGAGREYFYGISIGSSIEPGAQMVLDPNTFDTLDLISYLQFHQEGEWGMEFDEFSWIYDYNAHQDVVFEAYSGFARITQIDASSVVPVPPSVLLLGTGCLGLLGWSRRKDTA